ncbi:MAG: CPBP family intramembrane metalloprotease [Erythrobacter sp.]|nr:CPBP family intramembrane metalloprotease [Erythrobacter sp.]MBA4051882.1 CPBP family intramembrane metalloprotease [Erythrobacter sp.]
MDQITNILAICSGIFALGLAFGLVDRKNFSLGWLIIAVLLIALNDAMLTRAWGAIPSLLPESDWNWQGKIMALFASLVAASLAVFGWKRSGLTWRHAAGSLGPAFVAVTLYLGFFVAIAMAFGGDEANAETIAFQLTMPGLEEEIFYRGILLFAFNEAFRARVRFLGISWGWGALLSSLAFGLGHALSYTSAEGFALDPIYLALTAVPSLLAVWLRERTGSLVLPILAHNGGNAIPLLI